MKFLILFFSMFYFLVSGLIKGIFIMAFKIISLLNPNGDKYYLQKKYKIIFFDIWVPVFIFKFPVPRKLFFQTESDAKKYAFGNNFVHRFLSKN